MGVTCNLTAYEVADSIDVADNSNKIYVKLTATTTGESFNNYSPSGSITIDGTRHTFSKNIPKNKTTVLYEDTLSIKHNLDGKKSVAISYSFATGISAGTLTGSKTLNLSTIPRASSVTCADANIGSATTININRANTSFTHTISYSFGNLSGTIVEKTIESSVGWEIPTTFFAQIPKAKSGQGTITCQTYSNNTLIGTSTCKFNAFVANSEPEVNGSVVDINSKTIALTGDSNKLIKYCSNAKVEITATAKNSATIVSQKVVCGSKTGTSTNSTLNEVESGIFSLSCIDSRGFEGKKEIKKTLIEYIRLAFTQAQISRPNTTSKIINAVVKGNYFNGNFGKAENTLQIDWRYRIKNGEWSSYYNLTVTKNANTFAYEGALGTDFDFNQEYEFEFRAIDKVKEATVIKAISRGVPLIDIGKDDIVLNALLKFNEQAYLGDKKILSLLETNKNEGKLVDKNEVPYYVEGLFEIQIGTFEITSTSTDLEEHSINFEREFEKTPLVFISTIRFAGYNQNYGCDNITKKGFNARTRQELDTTVDYAYIAIASRL